MTLQLVLENLNLLEVTVSARLFIVDFTRSLQIILIKMSISKFVIVYMVLVVYKLILFSVWQMSGCRYCFDIFLEGRYRGGIICDIFLVAGFSVDFPMNYRYLEVLKLIIIHIHCGAKNWKLEDWKLEEVNFLFFLFRTPTDNAVREKKLYSHFVYLIFLMSNRIEKSQKEIKICKKVP
jgi:hypothetical protein